MFKKKFFLAGIAAVLAASLLLLGGCGKSAADQYRDAVDDAVDQVNDYINDAIN